MTIEAAPFSAVPSGPPLGEIMMTPPEIAVDLENHPQAQPFHQLLALELRAHYNPQRADEYVAQAIARFRKGDDESLLALAEWLYRLKCFETVLQVVPLNVR